GRKRWRLNHTPLFLDFLEGKIDFECTPWGIPCYTIFGWQRPCYLQSDGYTATYRELVETTDWSKYGRESGNVQCRNCMAQCGYEPTAVMATMGSLKQSVRAMAAHKHRLLLDLILDTDIGTDVDDALALAFAVRHPDITLRAVTTVSGDTAARARITARL